MGEKIHLWGEKVGILREKMSSFAEKVLSFEGEKRYCGGDSVVFGEEEGYLWRIYGGIWRRRCVWCGGGICQWKMNLVWWWYMAADDESGVVVVYGSG